MLIVIAANILFIVYLIIMWQDNDTAEILDNILGTVFCLIACLVIGLFLISPIIIAGIYLKGCFI